MESAERMVYVSADQWNPELEYAENNSKMCIAVE